MNDCTDLKECTGRLPDKPVTTQNQVVARASAIAALPLPEAEASLAVELDRIQKAGISNPLAALDEMLALLIGINVEILKILAPALLENTNLRAIEFGANGKLTEPSRGEAKALTGMFKTQEVIAKLMASRVRVVDELHRRGRIPRAPEDPPPGPDSPNTRPG